jgi:hypothetical protein
MVQKTGKKFQESFIYKTTLKTKNTEQQSSVGNSGTATLIP